MKLPGIARHQRGLTLIELMIALLISLLLVGGVFTVFMSNRQTYRVTEGVARIQENARSTFELLARDLRLGSANLCKPFVPTSIEPNATLGIDTSWLDPAVSINFGQGFLRGETSATAFGGAADSPAIQSLSAATPVGLAVNGHYRATTPYRFTFTPPWSGSSASDYFSEGDIAVVCDFHNAAIFKITRVANPDSIYYTSTAPNLIKYGCYSFNGPGQGDGGQPDGDSIDPEQASDCNGLPGTPAEAAASHNWAAALARLHAVRWYAGNNGRGGYSLYRQEVVNGAPAAPIEIADNLDNDPDASPSSGFALEYLRPGLSNYVAANSVGSVDDWSSVTSVRVTLRLRSPEPIDDEPLRRTFIQTIALRARAP